MNQYEVSFTDRSRPNEQITADHYLENRDGHLVFFVGSAKRGGALKVASYHTGQWFSVKLLIEQ